MKLSRCVRLSIPSLRGSNGPASGVADLAILEEESDTEEGAYDA